MADRHSDNLRRLAVFLILFAFWLVLSGHYDSLHLSFGLVCAALVAVFSYDLFLPDATSPKKLLRTWRFLCYLPWLLCQVVLANLHVVSLVIHPRKIRPQIIRFKTSLTSDLSKLTLGNSITLTPGTITVDIDDGEFYVHVLSDKAARELVTGNMERRIAHIFLEREPELKASAGSER